MLHSAGSSGMVIVTVEVHRGRTTCTCSDDVESGNEQLIVTADRSRGYRQ